MAQPEPVAYCDYIECPHCGSIAAQPDADGYYVDGQNIDGGCVSCGFPGQVSCDAETPAYWSMHEDDPKARCRQLDCSECQPPGPTT